MSQEARDRHRLGRGLARATVDASDARDRRDRELSPLAASDIVQQVHVNVAGKTGKNVLTQHVDVVFPIPFLNRVAPDQHNSTPNPTFSAGVEILTGESVILNAQVQSWTSDESSFIVGAKIRLLSYIPNAPRLRRFSAVVHLTFFGYGAPMEDDTEG